MTEPAPLLVESPGGRRVPNTSLHVAGLGLVFLGAGIGASALVEVIDGGDDTSGLVGSAAMVGGVGALMWRGTSVPPRVPPTSAFAAVAWTWVIASAAGAVPYLLTGTFDRPDDALFEAISGFTTTGATVLAPIEGNGAGILFWRSMTQWYGGMGMVVLAVSVLPFLGVGGLELIKAEAPGPTSSRLSPRVSETAKRLWLVYGGLTLVTVSALMTAGLSPYDAVTHAFTTVATAGFSPYDASIAEFSSVAVEVIVILAMFVAGANFTLHYRALRGRFSYWEVPEFRAYALLAVSAIGFVTLLNTLDGAPWPTALRGSAFNVTSILTSTGYSTTDFALWVPAAQLVLLAFMLSGAMTGSTSGGTTILRFQVLTKYAMREVRRVQHPRGTFLVKLRDRPVPERVVGRIAGFLILYVLALVVGFVIVASLGGDLVTSLSGVAASIGNTGPALGDAGPTSNYLVFPRPARAILMFLMLFGRLEIFPMLLMFVAVGRSMSRRRARSRRALATASARPGESGS